MVSNYSELTQSVGKIMQLFSNDSKSFQLFRINPIGGDEQKELAKLKALELVSNYSELTQSVGVTFFKDYPDFQEVSNYSELTQSVGSRDVFLNDGSFVSNYSELTQSVG